MILEKIRNGESLIIGLGRSGISTARFLLNLGAKKIVMNDNRNIDPFMGEGSFLENNPRVTVISGGHPASLISDSISLVIKSPGVPPHLDIIKRAKKNGIPVISEIELAYHFIKAPMIGITGTNGKTTTTTLIAEIFKNGGKFNVHAVGNIGIPLTDIASKALSGDIIVAELSSFQLNDIISFRPGIAVILNIGEDHLDYHGNAKDYFNAKVNILVNQLPSDIAVLNADDSAIMELREKTAARTFFFSTRKQVEGFCVSQGFAGLFFNGNFTAVCSLDELSLPGEHNLQNALAAATAAWAGGVQLESIGEVLRSFKGVEHRLEYVCDINGVSFVNDSKGTNPEACEVALQAYPDKKKILIAGGKDKEADFGRLVSSFADNEVKLLILIGETSNIIREAAIKEGFTSCVMAETIQEAVETAWKAAEEGDVVLLSPACASWDMFRNYEERGNAFKDAAVNIKQNQPE